MDNLKGLIAQAELALQKGASPPDVDEWLAFKTEGKVTSLDAARSLLTTEAAGKPGKASLWRPALQGALFNFADELAGLGAAVVPGGKDYRGAREGFRTAEAATREAFPKASMAAELVGGMLVPGLGVAKAATGTARVLPGLLRTTASGVTLGAGAGAVSAAGAAPELQDVPGAAAGGAAAGGVVGGALGLALRPVAALVGGMGRLMRDLIHPDPAVQRRTEALALKALQDAGMKPSEAAQRLSELRRVAPEAILADISPRLGRELRTAVNVAPELEAPVREAMTQRQAGQAGRLAGSLEETAGVTGAGAREAREQAGRSIRTLGEQVYGPLEGAEVVSPKILQQLQRPEVSRVYGQQAPSQGLTFGRLQRLRQDMQDKANESFRAGRGNEGVFWRQQVEELTSNLDEAAPTFRAANREYATASAVRGAFTQGARALDLPYAEVRDQVRRLQARGGEEAVDAYRMGFIEQLTTKLRRTGRNRDVSTAITAMGSDMERTLRVLFPTEASLEQFLARAQAERAFLATQRAALGNSSTAQQLSDAGQGVASDIIMGGAMHGATGAAIHGGRSVMRMLQGNVDQRARADLGRYLLSRQNPQMLAFLDLLERRSSNTQGRQALTRAIAGVGAPTYAGSLFDQ